MQSFGLLLLIGGLQLVVSESGSESGSSSGSDSGPGFDSDETTMTTMGSTNTSAIQGAAQSSDANTIKDYAFQRQNYIVDACTTTEQIAEGDYCYTLNRGNGICTTACNTVACNSDDGDCVCGFTSDCPMQQGCFNGTCSVDRNWESCAETRCREDSECNQVSSSCGIGYACKSGTCGYDCDEWCRDTFGEDWESSQARGSAGDGTCYGCNKVFTNKHYVWIMVGVFLSALVLMLIPGTLIYVFGNGRQSRALISPMPGATVPQPDKKMTQFLSKNFAVQPLSPMADPSDTSVMVNPSGVSLPRLMQTNVDTSQQSPFSPDSHLENYSTDSSDNDA